MQRRVVVMMTVGCAGEEECEGVPEVAVEGGEDFEGAIVITVLSQLPEEPPEARQHQHTSHHPAHPHKYTGSQWRI